MFSENYENIRVAVNQKQHNIFICHFMTKSIIKKKYFKPIPEKKYMGKVILSLISSYFIYRI